jgi:hypothetical protein
MDFQGALAFLLALGSLQIHQAIPSHQAILSWSLLGGARGGAGGRVDGGRGGAEPAGGPFGGVIGGPVVLFHSILAPGFAFTLTRPQDKSGVIAAGSHHSSGVIGGPRRAQRGAPVV